MKIWIYWFESNSWIYFNNLRVSNQILEFILIIYGCRIKFLNLFLYSSINKNWKIYWSKWSFTGLGLEYRCSSWGLLIMFEINMTWFSYRAIHLTHFLASSIKDFLVMPGNTRPSSGAVISSFSEKKNYLSKSFRKILNLRK